MRLYSDNPVVGCLHCGWEGKLSELNGGLRHKLYGCPECGVSLFEKGDDSTYHMLSQAKLVKMAVEALSDLDLAKLLLRQIEHLHLKSGTARGQTFENRLLEAALSLVRYPKGFDLNTFGTQELLDEQRRRRGVKDEGRPS